MGRVSKGKQRLREHMQKMRAKKKSFISIPSTQLISDTENKSPNAEVSRPKIDNKRIQTIESSDDPFTPCVYAPDNIIVDITCLQDLFSKCACTACHSQTLKVSASDSYGFAHNLKLSCTSCGYITCGFTSKKSEASQSYDVNKRIVNAFNDMGQGYASLQLFCSSMNMKPMTHKTFDMHITKIKAVCREVVSNVLSQTRQSVKEAYFEVDPAIANNPTLDITVSYDGTWQKRGHTSNYGVGCVVDVFTGYVIDFEVMSKFCHKCSIYSKKLGAKSKAFKEWHDRHIPDCEYNYTGSSPAMEMEAAKILWERSKSYGLRYTTVLSDGDAKTFSHLQQSKVYGDNVDLVKEECINHIHKRMGTALRNLVSDEKKRSSTIGGRKHGNLTAQKIEKIARYYRNAILQHSGNVPGMKNAIYAILDHCRSTDRQPKHSKCPSGEQSWCFYNRALAKNETPGSHMTHLHTPLSERVVCKMLPLFQRLASDSLLERCASGRTQNANESLHSRIWRKCPKSTSVTKRRVDIAVARAVVEYNLGRSTTQYKIHSKLGLSPGRHTSRISHMQDLKTKYQRASQKSEMYKKYRKSVKLARLKLEEGRKKQEGPTYQAGAF